MGRQGAFGGRGVLALEDVGFSLRRLSRRSGAALLVGVLLAVGLGVWLTVARSSDNGGPTPLKALSQTSLEEQVGVRVVRLAATGGGGLLDLRYQVIDPDKAVVVHSPESPPSLVDEETRQVFDRSYHSHAAALRRRGARPGVTYYVLFHNPGALIRPGSLVSVRIGGTVLEHVPVE